MGRVLVEIALLLVVATIVFVVLYALWTELSIPQWKKLYDFIDGYYNNVEDIDEGETTTYEQKKKGLHILLVKQYKMPVMFAWRVITAYENNDVAWLKANIK